MKRQKFLVIERDRNFGGVFGEKEKNTGKMLNGLKISRGTLNIKRNKKKWKLHRKRIKRY